MRHFIALLILGLVVSSASLAQASLQASLESGFHELYNLDFAAAQQQFTLFQSRYPDDPMGAVAEAAGLLFSELDRLGVLQSQMYLKDADFERRRKLLPDAGVHQRFDAALVRAQKLADGRLGRNAADRDALLAATLIAGLQADYAALIAKQNMAALHYTRQSTATAQKLLAICNDCYDAYVASGISQYLVGSLSFPLRWMLKLGGYDGNKQQGIATLKLVASRGHYLAPFARILLAIAYLREKDIPQARQLLAGLRQEFPGNPLFANELARLDGELR